MIRTIILFYFFSSLIFEIKAQSDIINSEIKGDAIIKAIEMYSSKFDFSEQIDLNFNVHLLNMEKNALNKSLSEYVLYSPLNGKDSVINLNSIVFVLSVIDKRELNNKIIPDCIGRVGQSIVLIYLNNDSVFKRTGVKNWNENKLKKHLSNYDNEYPSWIFKLNSDNRLSIEEFDGVLIPN